jgi:aryl-alcohol dehydrogenase-like predicted oxidoreductase
MRTIPFNVPGSKAEEKRISVLGLGCASMLGRAGRRESLKALSSAYDAGITFYDTARSYGYGECERLLGDFFRGARRSSVVLCTKFGILPVNSNGWKNRMKPIARSVLSFAPQLRSTVRRHTASQLKPGQFSIEILNSSIETSLTELKTDYVDILLMHSPPLETSQREDLLGAMNCLVETGKVRMMGVSAGADVIGAVFNRHSPRLSAAQFPLNPLCMALASQTPSAAKSLFLIANQVFGGLEGIARCRSLIERLRQDPDIPSVLREKLDPRDASLLPDMVFNCVLRDTGVSVAVPSMLHPKHLHTNIKVIEQSRFSSRELEQIRQSLPVIAESSADTSW